MRVAARVAVCAATGADEEVARLGCGLRRATTVDIFVDEKVVVVVVVVFKLVIGHATAAAAMAVAVGVDVVLHDQALADSLGSCPSLLRSRGVLVQAVIGDVLGKVVRGWELDEQEHLVVLYARSRHRGGEVVEAPVVAFHLRGGTINQSINCIRLCGRTTMQTAVLWC